MVKTSVLNDALNAINNAEKAGKRQVLIRPSSKVIVKFLSVMQKHGKSYGFGSSSSLHLPSLPPGLITRQWSQTYQPLYDLCLLNTRQINFTTRGSYTFFDILMRLDV